MNPVAYTDMLHKQLKSELERYKTRLDDLEGNLSEKTAESPPNSAYADLPYSADGMNSIAWRWVTDGRKQGEGAGSGTGCLAYYDASSDTWLRFSDDTGVAI